MANIKQNKMGKQELFWKIYTESLKHRSKARKVFDKIKKTFSESIIKPE